MGKNLLFLVVLTLISSCGSSNQDASWKKNLTINHVMRLPSKDKKSSLYSYYAKHKEARYGSTWFSIVGDSTKFDPFAEHFTLDTLNSEFNILGWHGDTIRISYLLSDSQPKNLQPFRRQVRKWKSWYLDINYYFANSFGGTTHYYFDSLRTGKDTVAFFGNRTVLGKSEKYSLAALKGQVRVSLGEKTIQVSKLETSMDFVRLDETGKTLTNQPRISIGSYELIPNRKIDWVKLKECGVFTEQLFSK